VTSTNTAPALYDAWVTHARTQRTHRDFRHRVYLWLVDLDRLPRPPALLRPFAEFRSSDHLGDPDRSIRANVDDYLAEQGIELAGGRVLMLANARVLGYVFNPLTVYWCHRRDGELACVMAEVHNTYGERHRYLLHPDAAGRARTDKAFYVSPFLTVEGHYDMSLRRPDERLAVSVTLHQDGAPALAATIRGVRRPASTRELVRMVLRRPFLPHWISILIHRHGIAMWLRRYPVTPRKKSGTRDVQEANR
jgi:hypothetical protein